MTAPEAPKETTGLSEAAVAALTSSFAAVVLAQLTEWLASAREAILGGRGRPSLRSLRALDMDWSRRVDQMMPDLIRAARAGWERTADELGIDLPFDPRDPLLLEQIGRTRNLLVNVDDEIYDMIIKVLANGADNGWTEAQIAAKIDNILSITGTVNWPNRAEVIARTEVGRFTEAGALSAVERYQSRTGRRMTKQWQDRDDSAVRRAHREVDGVTLPLRGLFPVGISRLLYPAAPNGAAHDVIACRCRLKYQEVRYVRR